MGLLVGGVFLIASLVIPRFIKDEGKSNLVGIILSAFTTGIFMGMNKLNKVSEDCLTIENNNG